MTKHTTLVEALNANATSNRSITFIEGKSVETTLTYADLEANALGLLHHLQEKGLSAGDEVILFLKNNQNFIEMFWACVLGGMVPVPIAPGISDEHKAKLMRVFNTLERPYLYTDEASWELLKKYVEGHAAQDAFKNIESKTLLPEQLVGREQKGVQHQPNPDDTAFIQFSSGSTSDPKGVVLTQRNLMTNIYAIAAGGGYTDTDVTLSWMPLTHDMGLIGFHLNMLVCNMSQCLMPTDLFSRRPLLWMQKASEHKANVLCSPNFGYKHFLKAMGDKTLEGVDLSHVRLIYNGAEPISTDLCDQFLDAMKAYGLKETTMFTVYGLAEATLAVAFPKRDIPYQSVYVDRKAMRMGDAVRIVDSSDVDAVSFAVVGYPVPDCEIKITNDNNETLGDDFVGDIQIKGPNVTAGYYKNPEANAKALTGDCWLNTGDLGFIHQGQLTITGRSKDIIFAHGLNYYPHDLEDIVQQVESLELGKVVAYGVRRDQQQADELVLFILHRGDLEIFIPLAQQAAKLINEQVGLEVSQVIPVKRIPKTTSGKVQRRLLADDYLNGDFDDVLKEIAALQSAGSESVDEGDLTPLQQELKTIFKAVVTDKPLGLSDNFFDVGISSLALAEIHQRIDDAYPGVLDVVDLFEYQTIAEVAGFMEGKLAAQ